MLFSSRHFTSVCITCLKFIILVMRVLSELMRLFDLYSLRLPIEPHGIRLLPSILSKRASFTISLFQMINYSTAYLHCDLSVCLRNHSECERVSLNPASQMKTWGSFITVEEVSIFLMKYFLLFITLPLLMTASAVSK